MPNLTLVIGNKNYSSWSLRPWLALKWGNIPFTEIRIPLDTATTKEQIQQYSPSGRVPVLLDGDLVIWESLAICEYLAEHYPQANLWPASSAARAIARSVSHEMHAGFSAVRQSMPMDIRSRHPSTGRTPAVLADIQRISELWRDCRTQYGQGGNFLFGAFSIADAMFAPVVTRFVTYGVELDPVCKAYSDAVLAFSPMREWEAAAIAEIEVLEHP